MGIKFLHQRIFTQHFKDIKDDRFRLTEDPL